MQATKPYKAEIKARGQLIIPKKIRQMKHLEEGQTVSLVPLGDVVIIMPQRLELDEARRRIAKILKESDVSAEEMLEGLVREREALYKERDRAEHQKKSPSSAAALSGIFPQAADRARAHVNARGSDKIQRSYS